MPHLLDEACARAFLSRRFRKRERCQRQRESKYDKD